MIPITLIMEGFLSYQEPVEIDFTGFELACVTGENGAGKSSLLDGITWALFGRARKHDESIINLNSTQASVCLIFSYEGNQYKVTRFNPRGNTSQLELYIRDVVNGKTRWNTLSERTLRETDQKIIEILHLDYESFVNASFFLQGEADQFTQQTPASRKRILSKILGLEIWEKYRSKALTSRRNVEDELARLEGRIAELLAELDEEESRKDQLLSLEGKLAAATQEREKAAGNLKSLQAVLTSLQEQDRQVNTTAKELRDLEGQILQIKEKLTQRESERDGYQGILDRAEEIQKSYLAWENAQASLAEWEGIAEKFRESEIKRQDPLMQIAAEKARILQQVSALESRREELDAGLGRVPGLKETLAGVQEKAGQAEGEIKNRDDKKEELNIAHQRQADAKAENPRLFKEMKVLEKRIKELEETEGVDCPLCGQELSEPERLALIQSLKDEGKELGDRYRENQTTLKEADQVVKDLQKEITTLSLAENNLRTLQAEADKINNQLQAIEEDQNSWHRTQEKTLMELQEDLQEETYAPEARHALELINAELKEIGYDAAEHDRIRELSSQGVAIQGKKAELDRAEAALKPLNREINDLEVRLAELEEMRQSRASSLEESRKNLKNARKNAPDTQEAERDLLDLKEKENILQREVGAAQQKVAVLEGQKERREELEKSRDELSQLVKVYRQLEGAFGKDGVPALLIEQALPQIETRSNAILERLSAGNMSVRFITQREYKASSREDKRETLEIQIQDQSGIRDYEMYSGGESFRIDFAIRLALSHILAQRAGARLQTLVIDEGFGSQDALGRQRLIEAINLVKDDFEKILVITHVDEIKDSFSAQLLVEKTPRGSQVTLV
jgi:exonuclease SbcC